jgi:beta-lactamase class A
MIRLLGIGACLFALLQPSSKTPAAPTEKAVERRLFGEIQSFRGEIGLAATNLETGESLAIRAETRFPTASLIKVAEMVEAYHRIVEGGLRRDTALTLRETDKAGDETVPLNRVPRPAEDKIKL